MSLGAPTRTQPLRSASSRYMRNRHMGALPTPTSATESASASSAATSLVHTAAPSAAGSPGISFPLLQLLQLQQQQQYQQQQLQLQQQLAYALAATAQHTVAVTPVAAQPVPPAQSKYSETAPAVPLDLDKALELFNVIRIDQLEHCRDWTDELKRIATAFQVAEAKFTKADTLDTRLAARVIKAKQAKLNLMRQAAATAPASSSSSSSASTTSSPVFQAKGQIIAVCAQNTIDAVQDLKIAETIGIPQRELWQQIESFCLDGIYFFHQLENALKNHHDFIQRAAHFYRRAGEAKLFLSPEKFAERQLYLQDARKYWEQAKLIPGINTEQRTNASQQIQQLNKDLEELAKKTPAAQGDAKTTQPIASTAISSTFFNGSSNSSSATGTATTAVSPPSAAAAAARKSPTLFF